MSEQSNGNTAVMNDYEGQEEPMLRQEAPLARRPDAPMAPRREDAPMRAPTQAQIAAAGPRTSEGTDIIYREIALAQLEFGEVTKTRTATIRRDFSYKYANLADVTAAIMPALKAHGLVPMQIPMGNRVYVRIIHGPSGQWIEGGLPLVLPDHGADVQRLGSALTYVRRYLLCMMLGIVAGDEDDDGAEATAANARRGAQRAEA